MKSSEPSGCRTGISSPTTSSIYFSRIRNFFVTCLLCVAVCSQVFGQGAISATWPMSAATTYAPTVTGTGASASNMVPGATFNSAAFNTDGYKCSSTVNWPTTATNGYQLDFPLSPAAGFNLSLSSLAFTIKISGSSGAMNVTFASQIDGGAFTTFGTTTTGTSNAIYNLSLTGLSVTCNSGHTMVLRAYVYAASAGTTASRNVFIKNMAFTGTASTGTTGPTITTSVSSLSFGSVTANTTSAQQSYTVSGSSLTPASGTISVTAPAGFQVSTTSGSGFASAASISYTGGTLAATTVFARFAPTAVQSYSGSISNAGGGATTKNVAVTGTGTSSGGTPSTGIFVSPSGNDANAGTFSAPYKTITQAVLAANPGDTIFVRGGTHVYSAPISISKSGTASARIYIMAYNGEKPVLDFSSMAVSSSNRGMNLSGSFWKIRGLDFFHAGDNGLFVSGSNNIIEFCVFRENSDTGLQLGGGASNCQVINCDSYFNADPANGNADGFAAKLDIGTNISFTGCRAWQNSDDGWDGYLRPSDNVAWSMDNCWCFMNGYLKNGSASAGNGNGFKLGGSDASDLRHDVVLTKCLAFYNRVKGYDQNHDKGSITLYNCTAFSNGTNYNISEALAAGEALTVKNCISAGTGAVTLGTFAVLQTNSWMSPFTVTNADFVSVDTTGVRGARAADGSLPIVNFMRLATGSDLINTGTNVGLPFNGTAPDLGCFETNAAARTAASLPVISKNTLLNPSLANFPNPLGNETSIRFTTSATGNTVVRLFTDKGALQQVVYNAKAEARIPYNISFSAAGLPAGVYLLVLENGQEKLVNKMIIAK